MKRRRRDGFGAYAIVLATVVGTAVIATIVLGKEHRTVYSTTEHFHRHLVADAFDPISATERGLSPVARNSKPGPPHTSIRAILLRPGGITLVAAGKPVRSITTPPRMTLQAVATAVGDPRWIASSHGVVTARAAVIADRGSTLVVGRPTHALVLASRQGVFLGARHATLELDGITVRPSHPKLRGDHGADSTRPFVVAQRRSKLVIRHSTFLALGHDWNSSYGITWASGSTGSLTSSLLERCFIAVYTDEARHLVIRGNVMRGNTLYGIDPHSGSRQILVEDNLAENNGRHGIIFSQRVTASVVRDNVARHNHLNGIMMDARSTGNVITGNVAEDNRGDGVVLAHSPGNTVTDNRIENNRVGVLVRGSDDERQIRGNSVVGNAQAAQGTSLAGNDVRLNGGQWRPRTIFAVWLVAIPVALLLLWLTHRSRRSRSRRLPLRRVAA
jgi:mannuronan 5-epimerase